MRGPLRDRTQVVTVAGHINEAGDVFAEDYPFPDVAEGEVVTVISWPMAPVSPQKNLEWVRTRIEPGLARGIVTRVRDDTLQTA